jgi:hypothetical protein
MIEELRRRGALSIRGVVDAEGVGFAEFLLNLVDDLHLGLLIDLQGHN